MSIHRQLHRTAERTALTHATPMRSGTGILLFNTLPVPSGGALVLSAHPASLIPLQQALSAYRNAGCRMLVSLLPTPELQVLGLDSLKEDCDLRGMQWEHCPIDDFSPPGSEFENHWRTVAPQVHALLNAGAGVAIHCRAGLGRTGTVAARILMERGVSASEAVAQVRQARAGSIETVAQEQYLQHLGPLTNPTR